MVFSYSSLGTQYWHYRAEVGCWALLFSCSGKHKSAILPLGEMTASVELGTLWEMSVILTFSENSQLPCHMSQQKLEALNFLRIFSFWFWMEKCPSAITLEMFPCFLCKIPVLHFNSLCVASDQLHSKVGIFISPRQLVSSLVYCHGGIWKNPILSQWQKDTDILQKSIYLSSPLCYK